MKNRHIFLEVASRIGKRLVDSSIWNGERCTWEIITSNRSISKNNAQIKTIAPGTIYQGTSGIALFLLELYKYNPSSILRKTIEGAISNSLSQFNTNPTNNISFYNGRTGISYLLYVAATYLERPDYLQKSKDIIETLYGKEFIDIGMDFLEGAASAIPILLKLTSAFSSTLALDIAQELGDFLISKAVKEPTGWSWNSYKPTRFRNLCGLAHGASGFGHAFIELYSKTGNTKYLYVAEQAFLYERQFFKNEFNNWPDFRYTKLDEYIYSNDYNILKKDLIDGKLLGYNTTYMNAWCHGASGIALSRLRAFEITGYNVYKEETKNALEGMLKLNNVGGGTNYSLCHGIAGNCELLIYAANIINPSYLDKAEELALIGWEEFESKNKSWPCGTIQNITDPSLMLGEAGIGYFYFRLFSNDTPSILLPTIPKNDFVKTDINNGFEEIQKKYIEEYFGKTIEIINETESFNKTTYFTLPLIIGKNTSDVTIIYEKIKEYLKNSTHTNHAQIKKQFQMDQTRYLKTIGILDYSKEYKKIITKKDFDLIDWGKERFIICEDCKLVCNSNKYVYQIDISKNENHFDVYILFRRMNNKIVSQVVNSFLAVMVNTLITPKSLSEIVDILINDLDYDASHEELKTIVKLQLTHLYNAGIVEITPYKNFEEQVLNTIQREVLIFEETLTDSEIALNALMNLIRYSRSVKQYEDEFYFNCTYRSLLSEIKRHLKALCILQYFSLFEKEDFLIDWENINQEFLYELETILPQWTKEIVIAQ